MNRRELRKILSAAEVLRDAKRWREQEAARAESLARKMALGAKCESLVNEIEALNALVTEAHDEWRKMPDDAHRAAFDTLHKKRAGRENELLKVRTELREISR